ncbi:hypothetical protein [Pontibacillus salicampi]
MLDKWEGRIVVLIWFMNVILITILVSLYMFLKDGREEGEKRSFLYKVGLSLGLGVLMATITAVVLQFMS